MDNSKEISLTYLFKIFSKHFLPIILSALIFAAAVFSYSYFLVKPNYVASASIIISNGAAINGNQQNSNDKIQSADLSASIYLVDTCIDILKSRGIYEKLSQSYPEFDVETLKNSFLIKPHSENSLFIDISVTVGNEQDAVTLVNAFANMAPEYILSFLPASLTNVVETAIKATQSSPRLLLSAVVGLAVGAIICFSYFVIKEVLDQTVHGEEDFTEKYQIPVLGVIPDFLNAPLTGG